MSHPSSFRDPESAVVSVDGSIVRRIARGRSRQGYLLGLRSGLFSELQREGLIPDTRLVSDSEDALELLLEQQAIRVITYPFEWPFEMMRDAALLHLNLLIRCLERGLSLKDGSSYNVQFEGAKAKFVDIGSFIPYEEGSTWAGYTQFCRTFLYPLFLRAYVGVAPNAWLRGDLEGIAVEDIRRLLPLRHRLRRSVLKHVVVQAALQAVAEQSKGDGGVDASRRLRRDQLLRFVHDIREAVARLRNPETQTTWRDYERRCHYTQADKDAKRSFLSEFVRIRRPRKIMDVGANVGAYSSLAAQESAYVIALEKDPGAADVAYRAFRENGIDALSLVVDVANPSPAMGWRGQERQPLDDRVRPDALLMLAVIHHLRLSANLPVRQIVDWMADVAPAALVEFVPKSDPRTVELLSRRPDVYDDYSVAGFEGALQDRYAISKTLRLANGRTLYAVDRRG